MAHPKRKTSKSRKRKRRSHLGLSTQSGTKCPRCGHTVLPHRVCPNCDHYKGREYKIKKAEGS